MTSKNNLSAFKRPAAKSVLQTATAPERKTAPVKPTKPETEKVSKRVQVLFTEQEFAQLNANRGGVPMSAYLRTKLKESGEI